MTTPANRDRQHRLGLGQEWHDAKQLEVHAETVRALTVIPSSAEHAGDVLDDSHGERALLAGDAGSARAALLPDR